jgi:uncharacterized protein (DUF488 family)
MTHDTAAAPARTIWTIGHSNHSAETLYALLIQHEIGVVADVRSRPYSRYASQFDREAIGPALQQRAIQYVFFGDQLGGRVDDPRFYDGEGHVLYDQLARSPGFCRGIERLLALAAQSRVAILCAEEDPANCHRRLLVGRVLQERGVHVAHLRGDGRAQSESELTAEENFRKTKGQLSLFDTEEPMPWKSTQSVSPKKTPLSSSKPCEGPESAD